MMEATKYSHGLNFSSDVLDDAAEHEVARRNRNERIEALNAASVHYILFKSADKVAALYCPTFTLSAYAFSSIVRTAFLNMNYSQ